MCSDYRSNVNYVPCLCLQKCYTADKMVLRALGLSFQRLPCLPFGALGTSELAYSAWGAGSPPACHRHLSSARGLWLPSTTPAGDPEDRHYFWRAQGDVSRFGSTNPEVRGPGRETRSVHTCQRLEGIYLPAFPIACFLSGENPFWQPRRWASNSCLRLIFHFNPSANGF